jgi:signal transduction histidine kinase
MNLKKVKAFLQRHILWVGFFTMIVPLITILSLQYFLLVKLETTSAVAQKMALKNYLEAITTEVQSFYRINAEQVLNISSGALAGGHIEKVAYHFKKKKTKGVKRLFLANFTQNGKNAQPQLLCYNSSCYRMEPAPDSSETRAVNVALAPWKLLSHERTAVESAALTVDERDPENRIILNPITDESSKVIGVAGMIVDQWYFKQVLLPSVIQKYFPQCLSTTADQDVAVTVHDGNDRLVLASESIQKQSDDVSVPLQFIFTDWRVGARSRTMTPEQWAHWNFGVNLSLSILMTVVLIGGIIMSLRAASREMKLSQMKTDFVSNVSHELRTPLASIRVFGEFLKLGRVTESEKILEYGEYIETESRRLTQLVNNILDFSKIESGQKTYHFAEANIGEVVTETLKTVEVRLKHHGFSVILETPQTPLPPAVIDPDAIAQAFMNLLDNAVKYSKSPGQILVRLGQSDGQVTIAVTDQGIGIPRQEQEKIFDKFYRVGTGLVHDVKGSGLGLAIVKHIVEAHRGKVTVESEPGQGSTFTLHLPAKNGLTLHPSDQPKVADGQEPTLATEA